MHVYDLLKLHKARWAELRKSKLRTRTIPRIDTCQQPGTDDCHNSNYRQHFHSCFFRALARGLAAITNAAPPEDTQKGDSERSPQVANTPRHRCPHN